MSYHQSNHGSDYSVQHERNAKLDSFRSQFDSYERNGSSSSLSAREYGASSTSRQQTLAQYAPQQRQQMAKQEFDEMPIRSQQQQQRPTSYEASRQAVASAAPPVASTRITRHRVVGASAAPFANDYSWNVTEN